MKSLLLVLFCLTQLAWAPVDEKKTSFTAEGMFLVKAEDGTLAKEKVSITFDMKNKSTTLTIDEKEIAVKKVWVKKVRNLTKVFMAYQTSEKGTYRILKGSYLKGSNLGTYSGDIFEVKKPDDSEITVNLVEDNEDCEKCTNKEKCEKCKPEADKKDCDCEDKEACGCDESDTAGDEIEVEEHSCDKCKTEKTHDHEGCKSGKCKTEKSHDHEGCKSGKCKTKKSHDHEGCKSGKCKTKNSHDHKGCKSGKSCQNHSSKMKWFMNNFKHVGVFYFSKKAEK